MRTHILSDVRTGKPVKCGRGKPLHPEKVDRTSPMARGSSIHFKPVPAGGILAVAHNTREVPPRDMLPPEHRLGNISVVFGDVEATYREKMALASKKALATPGYSPLEEGVMNLADPPEDHPCEGVDAWKVELERQVREACAAIEEVTGQRVLRADIHLDEGHIREDGSIAYNAHCHIVKDKTDGRGRVVRMERRERGPDGKEHVVGDRRARGQRLQDRIAEITGLERGEKDSRRKHISAAAYRALARQGRILNSAEREQAAQQGEQLRQQSARADAAEKAAGESKRDADNARWDAGLNRRAAERLDGEKEEAEAARADKIDPEDIAKARTALEMHTREKGLAYDEGYRSLRDQWKRENDRELRIGRARPHSQRDYSALRMAHLEIEAERRGAQRERQKRQRSTRRGRRQTNRARQERDQARRQQGGGRAHSGGGGSDRTEYQRLREVMGLFTGTRAAAGQSDYMEAKRHAGDAAWCAAQRALWERKVQQIGTTIEALRQQAAAREKERQRRKREREIRDLLDHVVQQGAANGIAGVPLPQRPPWRIGGFQREWDQARRRVIYRDAAGGEAFAVTRHLISGPGLARDDALRAALLVGAAKFGGAVKLTGSSDFRRRAEQQARALGIRVSNPLGGERTATRPSGSRRDEGR